MAISKSLQAADQVAIGVLVALHAPHTRFSAGPDGSVRIFGHGPVITYIPHGGRLAIVETATKVAVVRLADNDIVPLAVAHVVTIATLDTAHRRQLELRKTQRAGWAWSQREQRRRFARK